MDYELIADPVRELSETELESLHSELIALGRVCLDPLPHYQVFSDAPACFVDTIIVTVRRASPPTGDNGASPAKGALVGFTSALYLHVPGIEDFVIHTGLTCVHPSARRRHNLIPNIFTTLFLHGLSESPTGGLWITTVAEVASSLVHIAKYCKSVYPSPSVARPSGTHLRIARHVVESNARAQQMAIAPTAVWDEDRFVIRGSNNWDVGSCFKKDPENSQYWHRDTDLNEFYRSLLSRDTGDEVLQVAFVDQAHAMKLMEREKFVSHKGEAEVKVRLTLRPHLEIDLRYTNFFIVVKTVKDRTLWQVVRVRGELPYHVDNGREHGVADRARSEHYAFHRVRHT
jgi:hypothetical protein